MTQFYDQVDELGFTNSKGEFELFNRSFQNFCKDFKPVLVMDHPQWTDKEIELRMANRWESLNHDQKELFAPKNYKLPLDPPQPRVRQQTDNMTFKVL